MLEAWPLPCREIVRKLERALKKRFTTGHVSALLQKLEHWGVTETLQIALQWRLLRSLAETKTVELLVDTLRKR